MLEAWGAGVPVLSFGVDPGGTISRERVGLVSDTPSALLDDLDRLVSDPEVNDELGQRGFAYVRSRHSLEALCDSLEQITPGISSLYQNARIAS
jgi:glycosyltransferase involved in cell wall biosynthesis